MEKLYERINFENAPSKKTPLNEENMNKMDRAIDELDNRVISFESDLINNSDGVLVSGVLVDNDTDLSTGKYISNAYVGVGWKQYLIDNGNSYYTPESIDVSANIGGKLKISVTTPNNGSRFFGFCNSDDLVTSLYYEAYVKSQFVYNPVTNLYELFLDVTDTNFFFSYTNSVETLKIEVFPPQNVYKKDEIDKKFESVNGEIGKLECAAGMKKEINATITGLRLSAENTRIVSNHIDIALATSISIHQVPGYEVALYYKENNEEVESGYGWFSEIDKFNIAGFEYAYVGFRKQGNAELTDADLEVIKSSIGVFLYYEYSAPASDCRTVYVSTSGSDDNDGSASNPYATVNKALSSGASTVMMYSGIYEQSIDLNFTTKATVDLRNYSVNERVIFTTANRTIAETETLVSGYENVRRVKVDKTFDDAMRWIYQDGVNDSCTLIMDEERHPLQRGYEYRCHDTKIERCTATTLDEALAEIESSAEYKWYYDSSDSALYFSRPEEITADNPLCGHFGGDLFNNCSRSKSVKVIGIETKYMRFNVNDLSCAEIYDCKAANVFSAGAFFYDRCISGKFVRCEATRCQTGANGDGFNAHSYNTGDIKSKQTTVSLIDCWSHDNNDDGYSDHERSEITIIGGLYEHNKKGGVTPSYGSHCTCYNVYSRNNYTGFLYTGDATEAEGGKYGQMACIGCVAEGNNSVSFGAGYQVDGNGNSMFLVNCKSINNTTGYATSNNTNIAKLVDCGSCGDGTTKRGPSNTFIINNTTVVTE